MQLDPAMRELLERFGFDLTRLTAAAAALARGEDLRAANHTRGVLEPLRPRELLPLAASGGQMRAGLHDNGLKAIQKGWVGAVILAGGMATRFGGVVKANQLVAGGRTFLECKLADLENVARAAGAPIPVWIMTSFATDAAIREVAAARSSELVPITCAPQFVSLRLTPEGDLFRDGAGALSPYAPGHGDLTFALLRAGAIAKFRGAGGRHLFISNVDNLAATLDPAVIGAHMFYGKPMTAEQVRKAPGDQGGGPIRLDGKAQIIEGFRFPPSFDQNQIEVFNTNTFTVDARAIDRDFPLPYYYVEKQVDGRPAIQFERLVGELSAHMPVQFLEVERAERFVPVKDPEALGAQRPALEALLKARQMIG